MKGTRVRRTSTVLRITLFVNLMHPMWRGIQFALIGLKRMTIDGRSSMKRCPSSSETAWEDLSGWNYILSLKLFMQFALSILELKTSKKEKNNNIRTANRRQRENGRFKVEQRLLKKRLKEMPNELWVYEEAIVRS